MSVHRYSRKALRADYIRAGAGVALTLGPLAATSASLVASGILGGLGLLFVAFGCRTWTRQRCEVLADEDGVTLRALRTRQIPWRDLTVVDLRYFATRRDRSRGWMQLSLRGAGTRISLESTLDRFEAIAALAARAARQKGIALSASTLDNLRALGVPIQESTGRATSLPANMSVDNR